MQQNKYFLDFEKPIIQNGRYTFREMKYQAV